MRVPVIDGWRVSVIGSLAVLAAFAAACLTVSAYAFRRQTGERL
jgi:hypothetical protein